MSDAVFRDADYADGMRCASCGADFAEGDTIRWLDVPRVVTFTVPQCVDCAMQSAPLADSHPLVGNGRVVLRADGYVQILEES